jgi:hypothetical protein
MKKIIYLLIIIAVSCKCTQRNAAKTEKQQLIADSTTQILDTPDCIKTIIKKIVAEPITNPPSKIYSYTFKNKTVYYVPPVCCDNFSDLYDDSCRLIAHPDGGFTGQGDRKATTFQEEKTNEKLIWEDKRK